MKGIYSIFFVLLLFSSCSKSINDDTENPVIKSLESLNSNSEKEVEFPVGSTVKFKARFTDNHDLGSYRFDIHFAGDGHRHHVKGPKSLKAGSTSDWDFVEYGNFSGTDRTISFDKEVEDVAKSGPYHCIAYATDDAGNVATFKNISFMVTKEDMPVYDITSPDFNDLEVELGGSFLLEGVARAENGLSKLKYIIRSEEDLGSDIINEDELITGDDNKERSFSYEVSFPEGVPTGKYIILLLASDSKGNVGQFVNTFTIVAK